MTQYIAGKCPNKACSSNKKNPYLPVKVELSEKDFDNDRHYFEVRPHRCPICKSNQIGWKKIIM